MTKDKRHEGKIERIDATADEIAAAIFAAADSPKGESGSIPNQGLGLAADSEPSGCSEVAEDCKKSENSGK